MAIFLTGSNLNAKLESLFECAEEYLILISPYIKLHERYVSALKTKKENPNLEIIIVFGKNEDDFSKSMKQEDFNFFKDFPNIEIRYEKRLHAKYYANESLAILTSMNLYNFSQDNNIEAGVLTSRKGILGNLINNQDTLEDDASLYFEKVIRQSDLLFKKVPRFENTMLGLSKRYISSDIETDRLSDFFNNKIKNETFRKESFANKQSTTQFINPPAPNRMGFCIRTGIQIPFNKDSPMCDSARQNWKKFSNNDYPEKYCHFSGEPSNGETTYSKPILRKNWAKAKELYNL